MNNRKRPCHWVYHRLADHTHARTHTHTQIKECYTEVFKLLSANLYIPWHLLRVTVRMEIVRHQSLISTAPPVSVTSSKLCVRFCVQKGSASLKHIGTHVCTHTYAHLETTDLDELSNFPSKSLEAQDSWHGCVTSLVS